MSILDGDGEFLGYGGLTHIDWEQQRAEVSFLVDPERASDPERYECDLRAFLGFLQDWAFGELGLHRLFTETYAFREHHLSVLESAGFQPEGRMRDHVADPDSPTGFADSLLHGLLSPRGDVPLVV